MLLEAGSMSTGRRSISTRPGSFPTEYSSTQTCIDPCLEENVSVPLVPGSISEEIDPIREIHVSTRERVEPFLASDAPFVAERASRPRRTGTSVLLRGTFIQASELPSQDKAALARARVTVARARAALVFDHAAA
jgi:hypothetical protein